MNLLQRISRQIIRSSFHASVWTIEKFHDVARYEARARELSELPEGTLGKDIADCLDRNGLRLVRGFESHDLKHVLLDSKMNPLDEIRLQAFMLGNGNYSVASFAIFIFGAFFLPDLWITFIKDFRAGRRTMPIKNWTVENYAHCQTETLREVLANYRPEKRVNGFEFFLRSVSWVAGVLGTLGMLFSLPYLFSSYLPDLVGAGFAFIGGAIIASAGLISLSVKRRAVAVSQ